MIEENNLLILKLCNTLNTIANRELRLDRARYKVYYYQKIKTALSNPAIHKQLPDGYFRWKDSVAELNKKIETSRLELLRLQGLNIKMQSRTGSLLNKLLKEANSRLVFQQGRITGLAVGGTQGTGNVIPASKFSEMADQYHAARVMNRVFNG